MKDQEQNVKAWEGGRTRLIDDHKFKRENEQTHRAALYVTKGSPLHDITDRNRSLPGLLEGVTLLRVCFLTAFRTASTNAARHQSVRKKKWNSMTRKSTGPARPWSSRKHRLLKCSAFHSLVSSPTWWYSLLRSHKSQSPEERLRRAILSNCNARC